MVKNPGQVQLCPAKCAVQLILNLEEIIIKKEDGKEDKEWLNTK